MKKEYEEVKTEPVQKPGGLLNQVQADKLQQEIESNYKNNSTELFDPNKDDIRMNVWNYDTPIASKTVNGVDVRIVTGLLRKNKNGKREQTYLLYAGGKIAGEFYSVTDAKKNCKFH